jgi:hypothetical protein
MFAYVKEQLNGTCIFPQAEPKHVYHYTTIDGLTGILSSGKLWATDLSYVNDATEYVYADILIEDAVRTLKPTPFFNDVLKVLWQDSRTLGFDVYAACFCQSGNLLS